jgi:hypothetical protein
MAVPLIKNKIKDRNFTIPILLVKKFFSNYYTEKWFTKVVTFNQKSLNVRAMLELLK